MAQLSERLGSLKDAVSAAIKAADLYLSQKDVDIRLILSTVRGDSSIGIAKSISSEIVIVKSPFL